MYTEKVQVTSEILQLYQERNTTLLLSTENTVADTINPMYARCMMRRLDVISSNILYIYNIVFNTWVFLSGETHFEGLLSENKA